MTTVRRDLVSTEVRGRFRDLMRNVPMGQITGAFADVDLARVRARATSGRDLMSAYGQRRGTAEGLHRTVDWSDPNEVDRAFRAWSRLLEEPERLDGTQVRLFHAAVRAEGHDVDDATGAIRRRPVPAVIGSLSSLPDAAAIREHLDRINGTVETDPPVAIGSAKELIESTAKVVLTQLGVAIPTSPKLTGLVHETQQALWLTADKTTPGPDGTEAAKKILRAVSNVAIGVDELRNAGYGTGHGGGATARAGLHPRHARLAVNAAVTWCTLILDTLDDADAPWRAKSRGQRP